MFLPLHLINCKSMNYKGCLSLKHAVAVSAPPCKPKETTIPCPGLGCDYLQENQRSIQRLLLRKMYYTLAGDDIAC